MKIKVKPTTAKPKVVSVCMNTALVEKFKTAMDEVEDSLVERAEEVAAAKLCLLTKGHMMLDGKHGTAKSLFAESVFSRIMGARLFKKMLMKTTQTDELFGPMNSKRYREDAVWEHNIAGMLPDCHFFFGDEIYRASDQALPAMLNILNERQFINGPTVVRCPLRTAIGTTNFVTDNTELDAFHDRWHVRVEVQSLSAMPSVTKMLNRYLSAGDGEDDSATVSLAELTELQTGLRAVTIPAELLEVYVQIAVGMVKGGPITYISDRRKCAALRFVQASALLNDRLVATADDLAAARYALITVRNVAQEQLWNSAYSTHVQNYNTFVAETQDLVKFEKWIRSLESRYDDSLPQKDATALYHETKKGHDTLAHHQPQDKQPRTPAGIARKEAVLRKMVALLDSLKNKVAF